MVFNLCLHPFHTTIHSSKLCADGYDVTNLVSADPAVRRRGFKLEYFLRPPLQVTLTFDFKVEICRVDAELWPWGMDRGQACKKLEISTCSDSTSDFKVVGRCELREETKVCFSHSHCRPRPPFQHPPPPLPTNCRHEALWSRGLQSLGAVTQLRVALPFGGSASAIGLKSLSVWGQPARCCPAEQVEKIHKAHEASVRPTTAPASASALCPPKLKRKAPTSQSFSVPEEFLDPITQEVMVLPMLLPGGVSVDHSTLDEYQKREATWGRAPNDPFTGVPFSASSQPLPNPQLKSRIDHFLLQSGQPGKEGRLGRQAEGKDPQPSRLVASEVDTGANNTSQTKITTLNCEQARKRDFTVYANNTPEDGQESQLPQEKKQRINQVLEATCSSHEQRLSASLDEALSSALEGRPSFTSNLSLDNRLGTESLQLYQHRQTEGTSSTEKKSCSGCSCSISAYATPSSPIYRLTCGHFLCRSCLQKPSNTRSPPASGHVACPACQSTTLRSDIIRVHQ